MGKYNIREKWKKGHQIVKREFPLHEHKEAEHKLTLFSTRMTIIQGSNSYSELAH